MANKKFLVYIVLITLALLTLLWVQYYWISYSIKKSNSDFKAKSSTILKKVIKDVEESYYCVDFFSEINMNKNDKLQITVSRENVTDTIKSYYWSKWENDSIHGYKEIKFPIEAKIEAILRVQYLLDTNFNTNSEYERFEKFTINSYRNIVTGINKLANTFDTILNNTLKNEEILLPYQFCIIDIETDSVLYSKSDEQSINYKGYITSSIIFHDNYFIQPFKIYLDFPDKSTYILKNLWIVILGSLLSLVLLIIFLVFFIRNMLNQRRLTEMKSDFIHNMTHEFKTPISNINLALDTIESQQKGFDGTIHNIIREENIRLKNNIDIIINASFEDQKKLKIQIEEIDLNKLIDRTILMFENKPAKIIYQPSKNNTTIHADETHLTNVIYNLIDNAIKYSENKPEIIIFSSITENFASIVVEDNGIGMNDDELKKIFEKFYRIPTGKKHNVKGFGLGLAYVKSIIDMHNGKIKVVSKINMGSKFEILLPHF